MTEQDKNRILAEWVFGKDGVEFGHTIVDRELIIYRRTGWNEQDEDWNIEVVGDFFHDLNACFKSFTPLLRERGIFAGIEDMGDCYLATLRDWNHSTPISENSPVRLPKTILADDREEPATAFCEAVLKLVGEK